MYVVTIVLSIVISLIFLFAFILYRIAIIKATKRVNWLKKQSKMVNFYVNQYNKSSPCSFKDFWTYDVRRK